MKEVLFICQGNVGRSQMAEAFYNRARENTAISAGIADVAEKYGGRPTQEIIDVMLQRGIDVSGQKIKQVTPGMLNEAGNVVVLCDKGICPSFLVSNENIIYHRIEDPYQADMDTTRQIRDEIEKLVSGIVSREN